MAKYIKKKMNVGLFVLLLIMAFVPGIIYAIYCAIPLKVPTTKPKNNGSMLRLIGSGLALAFPIIGVIYFGEVGGLFAALSYMSIGFAALMLLLSICTIKTKGVGPLMVNTFAALFYFAVAILYAMYTGIIFYLWLEIPMIAGAVVTLIGISIGKKYVYYEKYAEEEIPAEK